MRYLLLLPIILCSLSLRAGPWPKAKGEGYFKLYEWWLRFDEHFTSTGELDPNATLGLYNTTLYGEYGVSDRFTLVANIVPFSRNTINAQLSATRGNTIEEGESLNGIGDSELGFRYAITKPGSSYPVAFGLNLGLPLGKDVGGEMGNLQTGDGEFNQLVSLSTGRSFTLSESIGGFASVLVGYNNRSKGFSDECRFGLEAGANFAGKKLWLIGRLTGSESTFNGDADAAAQTTSVFSNNAEYWSLGGEINYNFTDHFGVSAGLAGALSGRIIAAAPTYSLGVFLTTGR